MLLFALSGGDIEPFKRDDITIVLGGDEYFPPFEYVDQNGVYKGFNVDIIRAIAIDMGLDIDIVPMTWKDAIAKLEVGEIDGLEGMKRTAERDGLYDFSDPYYTSALSIFIEAQNNYIKSLDDLTHLKVAVQADDVAYAIVAKIAGVTIVETDSQLQALELLIAGEVDGYIGNRETGLYSIQKYEYQDYVKIIGESLNPQHYCIALKRGSQIQLSLLNRGLANIKKDGTYDKIYKKWFGEQIYATKEALMGYLYAFLAVLVVLVLIFGLMMRWNRALKREVKKQTQSIREDAIYKAQIINSIFSGLVTFNSCGDILTVNQNVGKIFQCASVHFIGKNIVDTPLEQIVDHTKFQEVLKSGTRYINLESPAQIADKKRQIEYNIYPLKTTRDDIEGITITLLDITEEKQNAEMIRRKDKLASLGRLTTSIAHEIRNPLTAIKTYIELIPQKISTPSFQRKIVEDVPADIARVNALISQVLDYAKPQTAKCERIDLKEITQKIVNIYSEEISEKAIALKLAIATDIYAIIDINHYKQIVANLLLNAVDAVANAPNPTITISAQREVQGVKLCVIDNGVGFKDDAADLIFEPFYTTKTGGTGLGLAIVQQLLEENQGQIYARRQVGRTVIELHLRS